MNDDKSQINLKYLDYIDGLKGIAIIMILIFHASLAIQGETYFLNFREKVEHLSRGVHLFFIISGFSLFHSALQEGVKKKFFAIRFYIKRFFRIFPLWWMAVILYRFQFTNDESVFHFLATFFLFFGIFENAWTICIVPVGWSLFVEESFYLFFPLWKKIFTNSITSLIGVILSFLIAIIWYEFAGNYFKSSHFLAIHPLGNYYAFFCGIFLFFLNRKFLIDSIDNMNWFIVRAVEFFAIVGIIMIFYYDRVAGTLFLLPFFISSMLKQSIIRHIVCNKIIRMFGACCYSIYLFHGLIQGYLYYYEYQLFDLLNIRTAFVEYKLFITLFFYFPICLAFGMFSRALFEKKSINYGKKLISKLELSKC